MKCTEIRLLQTDEKAVRGNAHPAAVVKSHLICLNTLLICLPDTASLILLVQVNQ